MTIRCCPRTLLDVGRVLRRRLEERDAALVRKGLGFVEVHLRSEGHRARARGVGVRPAAEAYAASAVAGGRAAHLALALQVALVAYHQLVDVLARIPVNLVEPLLHVVEGLTIRDVVHNNDAVRSAVVAGRDRPEALLPGCVPLQARSARASVWCGGRVWAAPAAAVAARRPARRTHNLQFDRFAVELNGADLEVHADGADVRLRVRVVGCARRGGAAGADAKGWGRV